MQRGSGQPRAPSCIRWTHVEASDLASVLRRLALGIVEIRWHRDHGVRHWRSKEALCKCRDDCESLQGALVVRVRLYYAREFGVTCCLLHLPESEGAHLARGVLLALGLDPGVATGSCDDLVRHVLRDVLCLLVTVLATDEALCRVQGVGRVGHCHTLRGESDLRGVRNQSQGDADRLWSRLLARRVARVNRESHVPGAGRRR